MTGPEHYRAAEQALTNAGELGDQYNGRSLSTAEAAALTAMVMTFMNAAQVHATLAVAAAMFDPAGLSTSWQEAIS